MVLVTGATGLVGSHLVLHLLDNHESVRAIYRSKASMEKTRSIFRLYQKELLFEKIEWIEADITDVPALEKAFPDVNSVYHCAAQISFDPNDEKILRKVNIEGTANIVNCALANSVRKLVYVSSIAALGNPKEFETEITEETEWNPELPHSDYAISKYGAEMEVWRGWQEGIEVAIINPGVILGPGFWQSGSGEIFLRVKNGLPFYTKGTTGFISVGDVVKMLHQLMDSDISGERFTAVAANSSYENILKMVARSLHVKSPTMHASPLITAIVWRIDWLISCFGSSRKMSRSMAASLHIKNWFSNEKARTVLEFKFEELEKSVFEIADVFRKSHR